MAASSVSSKTNLHLEGVPSRWASHQSDFNPGLFQHAQVRFGSAAVGDDFLQGGHRDDSRETATSKLAGIADCDCAFGDLDHYAIDFGFEEIGSAEPVMHVEAVDAEE
jgi:hypothetical protein